MALIRHKFHATRTENDGISFSSKKEAAYYQKLKDLQKEGKIVFFLRQVPLALPGNTKYVCDFLVFWATGEAEFVEVKGFMTDIARLKLTQCEAIYPIKMTIV